MLKKKNIAMVMAAATVATYVAPVFAAVETEIVTDEAKLIADVQKMLDTRYANNANGKGGTATDEYENSVYEITETGTANVIKSVSELKKLIEMHKVEGTALNITVTDKGHKVVDGVIYATEKNEYVKYTSDTLKSMSLNEKIGTVDHTDGNKKIIKLTNSSVDPIVVTTDNYELDLTKPVDKDGNLIDPGTEDEAIGRKVVGFKNVETGKVTEKDIPAKVVAKYDFRCDGYTTIEANISEYVVDGIYTEAGAELVNTIVKANANENNTVKVVKNGKSYEIVCNTDETTNDLSAVEVNTNGGYKLTLNLEVKEDKSKAVNPNSNVQIIIKSKTQKELADLRAAMIKNNLDNDLVEAGKGIYTTLAGEDRFETAIEVSKASYKDKGAADAVVLVGESAIVDGLAAAPLAKQKNAPILLTKKDAVGDATLEEIKRVIDKNQTVYLVGGEHVISKDVEAQLIKEMNARIVRLAGEDRFETSLEIAKTMMSSATIKEAFVVGGDGEADAMSIASVASMKTKTEGTTSTVAPIIVTPATGLTKDAKNFIEKYDSLNKVDVIGGEAKVSTQVLKDIKSAEGTLNSMKVSRIAGETRQETNAKVIENYFKNIVESQADHVYVAKDGYVGGNDKLIDALAVAPLAGKNNAPIVLATEDLTKEQADKIGDANFNVKNHENLVKVGNGISETVIQKLMKLLGL